MRDRPVTADPASLTAAVQATHGGRVIVMFATTGPPATQPAVPSSLLRQTTTNRTGAPSRRDVSPNVRLYDPEPSADGPSPAEYFPERRQVVLARRDDRPECCSHP